jgi:hypothetical protein
MAHIADFLVDTPSSAGLNNYIARELSPHSSHDAVCSPISLLSFSDGYIVNRSSPGGREGEVCLEDASTDGTTQIPTVPHKGQTIGSSGTEECGCRAVTSTIHDHRTKWEYREGSITTWHCTSTEAQGANAHPEKKGQCARIGSNDHSAGDSHGLS